MKIKTNEYLYITPGDGRFAPDVVNSTTGGKSLVDSRNNIISYANIQEDGTAKNKGLLLKFSSDGKELWAKQAKGRYILALAIGKDGVYIATTSGHPVNKIYLQKFSGNGRKMWTEKILDIKRCDSVLRGTLHLMTEISINKQGQIYLASLTVENSYACRQETDYPYAINLAKINADGKILEKHELENFVRGLYPVIHSVDLSKDGTVIVGGSVSGYITTPGAEEHSGYGTDPFIRKYNSNGTTAWTKNLATGYFSESITQLFLSDYDGSVYYRGSFGDGKGTGLGDGAKDDLGKLNKQGMLQWRGVSLKGASGEGLKIFHESMNGSLYLTGLGNEKKPKPYLSSIDKETGVELNSEVIIMRDTIGNGYYRIENVSEFKEGDLLISGNGDLRDTGILSNGSLLTTRVDISHEYVRSKKSTTLSSTVVELDLLGKRDINGIGNYLNNEIKGNNGDNLLKGLAGDDILKGGKGNDILRGGSGGDILEGGTGDDIIHGGEGQDKLKGGSGADTYLASKGRDTIYGFNIQDGDVLSGFGGISSLDISDIGKYCSVSGNGFTARLKGINAVDLITAMESVFA